jgi:hypothetical protein
MAAAFGAPVIWILLIAGVTAPAYLMLTALGFPELTGIEALKTWQASATAAVPGWLSALGFTLYVRLASAILTKL